MDITHLKIMTLKPEKVDLSAKPRGTFVGLQPSIAFELPEMKNRVDL